MEGKTKHGIDDENSCFTKLGLSSVHLIIEFSSLPVLIHISYSFHDIASWNYRLSQLFKDAMQNVQGKLCGCSCFKNSLDVDWQFAFRAASYTGTLLVHFLTVHPGKLWNRGVSARVKVAQVPMYGFMKDLVCLPFLDAIVTTKIPMKPLLPTITVTGPYTETRTPYRPDS